MSFSRKRRLLTVEDYHRMGEVGILPVKGQELINGDIIEMSPIGSKHAAIVDKASDYLKELLRGKATIRVQNPIIIQKYSEPEPDISVVAFRSDYYADKHPTPEEVYLLIEVADSSIEFDRKIKTALYAKAGIPAYWIIDLEKNQLESYSLPESDHYSSKKVLKKGDSLSIPSLGKTILVQDLLL